MKEYIKHIRHTHADDIYKMKSWCGEFTNAQFVFLNIDYAAYERMNDGDLLICKKCLKEIIKTLKS